MHSVIIGGTVKCHNTQFGKFLPKKFYREKEPQHTMLFKQHYVCRVF